MDHKEAMDLAMQCVDVGWKHDETVSYLCQHGLDQATASNIVNQAEALISCTSETHTDDAMVWLAEVAKNPMTSGASGCLLVLLTVIVTLVGAFYGIAVFPSGTYPRIILALPGLLVGGLFYFVFGYILYAIKQRAISKQDPIKNDLPGYRRTNGRRND